MVLTPGRSRDRAEIVELLLEARARTLLLVSPLSEEDLRTQHSPLMSPLVWDLGHVGHFEEVWLLEKLDGGGDGGEGLRGIYNPFEHPRSERGELSLPSSSEALEYMGRVRRSVLDHLPDLDLPTAAERPDSDPLLREGFVFGMVLQHEYQHNETILQTLQLKKGKPYRAPRSLAAPDPADGAPPPAGSFVRFPGGEITIGTDEWGGVYDNERPRHRRTLEPFWIGASPVTEGEYAAFVDDGGYERAELWSREGWAWREEGRLGAPGGWISGGDGWNVGRMDRTRPLDPRRPVCHVSYHEAEAYARWAEARLPTEFEWEAAASWDPAGGVAYSHPWGDEPPTVERANVDQALFDTTPVGSYPENLSPIGCYGMIGDVWEWTSSDFRGYPGYRTFPYEEYSEAFFGSEYKVLRGGSWATRPGAIRNTFRNWDFPIRRQIFSGFRMARDE
ncbi:MAG: ergothioneine biosynthesis protein EgtB [Gemmatimonadota bacterium]